jgi:ABC-type branched-subunit amino acid transport system ATPase component
MALYTVCYSARGTGVLRTESVVAEEAQAAIAQVKRRLGASRTFQEARVFEDGELRFNVSTDARGMATAGGGTSPIS